MVRKCDSLGRHMIACLQHTPGSEPIDNIFPDELRVTLIYTVETTSRTSLT